jgi:hypothetical protein
VERGEKRLGKSPLHAMERGFRGEVKRVILSITDVSIDDLGG